MRSGSRAKRVSRVRQSKSVPFLSGGFEFFQLLLHVNVVGFDRDGVGFSFDGLGGVTELALDLGLGVEAGGIFGGVFYGFINKLFGFVEFFVAADAEPGKVVL